MTDPTPAVEALDVDCEHAVVLAYRFDDPTHETFGRIALWGCQNCRRRFEPRALTPAQPVAETTAPSAQPVAFLDEDYIGREPCAGCGNAIHDRTDHGEDGCTRCYCSSFVGWPASGSEDAR